MNKICGYSCEHNKGGVCQITMCDKQIYITTKTDEPLQKQLEKYTKYKIQKDENFELRKIHELQQELQRKDNNWNELKNELEQEIATVSTNRAVDYNNPEWWYKKNCYGNILDKMKELEESK